MAIVFVPGIQGSKLVDTYPLEQRVRWSLEDLVVGDLIEDPLDFRLRDGLYDDEPEVLLRAGELLRYAYAPMIHRLRAWVDPRLYVFPYDWRLPLDRTAHRLDRFIEHLRGKLAEPEGPPRISFVTHSAGGLILRAALGLRPQRWDQVDRIVFIAPPFRGSGDVPRALVAGGRNGWFSDREDYRKLARSFPSIYQLVPDHSGAAVDEQGRELDLFDAGNWQANVRASEDPLQERLLADAAAFRRGRRGPGAGHSPAPMLGDAGLREAADRILVLCASGVVTVQSLPVLAGNARNPNWFDFENQRTSRWGDGRVLLLSSAVPGITLAAFDSVGEHGKLCRQERIIDAAAMWLQGRRVLRMRPRRAIHSVERPGRAYFEPWDGSVSSLEAHVV